MYRRHYGLTKPVAESYLEAASVCLNRHHLSPQVFLIEYDTKQEKVNVAWAKPDDRILVAWANLDDATRDGAYAVAIATVEHMLGFIAVSRAERRSGADYYVAPPDTMVEDLEDCYRLEVSGTSLDLPELRRRLRNKVEQLNDARNDQAIAVVVGFNVKQILLELVNGAK